MKKTLPFVFLAAIIALVFAFFEYRSDDDLHIFFLDVGQGDAVLIKRGQTEILVDGGPSPGRLTGELGSRLPLWDRTIELVVLTHPHQDHLAGLVEVIKRYEVGAVIQPAAMPETEDGIEFQNGLYSEWQKLLSEKKTHLIDAFAGQTIEINGIEIQVINPRLSPFSGTSSDADNNSIVLNVTFGDFSFLLTSDIYSAAESSMLLSRLVPDCSVLKIAHHGSGSSTSQEFLNVSHPEAAVISVGENNYGQPDYEVLGRLSICPVYRTDENGTIEFVTNGNWLRARTAR
jgi:competence protein ComEC